MVLNVRNNILPIGLILLLCFNFSQAQESASGFNPIFDDTPSGPTSISDTLQDLSDSSPVIPSVDFVDELITEVFQPISETTGWSIFCTEEAGRKKVSFWAKDITALEILEQAVKLAGLTYRRENDTFSIMTYKEYAQHFDVEKHVISLKYANPSRIESIIKGFLTENAILQIDPETKSFILFEVASNLTSLRNIINQLDTPTENTIAESIDLDYSDCVDLADVLGKVFSVDEQTKNKSERITDQNNKQSPSNSASPPPSIYPSISSNKVSIFAIAHSNQLVVVGRQSDIEEVRKLVRTIDIAGNNMMITVRRLEFADAQIVSESLEAIFNNQNFNQTSNTENSNIRPRTESSDVSNALLSPGNISVEEYSNVTIQAVPSSNQLIIRAYKGDVERIDELLSELDVFIEPMTQSYLFTYIEAASVYPDIQRILNAQSQRGSTGQSGRGTQNSGSRSGNSYGSSNDIGLALTERTNAITVSGPPSIHRIMTSLWETIDKPGLYEAGVIEVYKIQYGKIEEIAATLTELLVTPQEEDSIRKETEVGLPPQSTVASASTTLEEMEEFVPQVSAKVSINATTNSIIVQATSRQQREVQKLITSLDIRRKQVLIEAMIVELSSNDNTEFGLELGYKHSKNNNTQAGMTSFGLSMLDFATRARTGFINTGGNIAILNPNGVQAIIHALESNDQAQIQSNPQVLVNDNEVGQIKSITEEPTKQTNQGETTTTTSFGEYVPAGTEFAITPHISDNNDLTVTYTINLSSFGEKADATLPPARNTSEITCTTMIPNGHTIVVGGILRTSNTQSISKVPILGDIPLLGMAFRSTINRKQYIRTYLFITPTIIDSEDFGHLKHVSNDALKQANQGMGESSQTE